MLRWDLDELCIVDQTTEQEDTNYRSDFVAMAKEASEDVIVESNRDEYERYVHRSDHYVQNSCTNVTVDIGDSLSTSVYPYNL